MADRLRTVLWHLNVPRDLDSRENSAADVQPPTNHKVLRFTLDNPILSKEQRDFYEKNGFLVIRNLVPRHKLEKYRERFEKVCKREVKIPGLAVMHDVAISRSEFVPGQKAVTKIQFFQNDEVLFDYCADRNVVDYVQAFVGNNVVSMHTMLINKPPDPGRKTSRHPMHQDLHFFPFRPADRIVCAWTAMEKVNRDNGCLVVLPGTHKGPLLEHEYPKWEGGVNKLYHGIRDYDPSYERTHLVMEPGDTVFFHPLLVHGSGMNRTTGFRKSISCHYASGDCTFVDTAGTTQDLAREELVELTAKKLGMDKEKIPWEEIWKNRSRPVRGTSAFKGKNLW